MKLIIDGPNGIGKSFYCNSLKNVKICHHNPPKIKSRLLDEFFYKLNLKRKSFVLDRFWISEYIYGTVYNDATLYQIKHLKNMIRYAKKHSATILVFIPTDLVETWKTRVDTIEREQENHPHTPTLEEYKNICQLYEIVCRLLNIRVIKCSSVSDYMKEN